MLDVLIVGSGPAGLSAAVYARRAGLDALVLEMAPYGIGQIAESSQVDNYLGFAAINGYELGEKFREHAVQLGAAFQSGRAERFERTERGWTAYLANGTTLAARAVIYAAGARHRRLGAEGEEEFAGRGVSYCATCDGAFFKGKSTVVAGGGNTAMDEALYLSEFCKKVYLVHRRDAFRGSPAVLDKIRSRENIEVVTEAVVERIAGETKVAEIFLKDGRKILADGIFIAVGMEPQTDAVKEVVELDRNGYVVADETGKTSAEGFFAAGDVRTKALRQVVTAVSDGANAAVSASEYLRL